jgi:FdhD protein
MAKIAYAGLDNHRAFSGVRWSADGVERVRDSIAEETPIALKFNALPFAVMMATPQDLTDFALGFSVSEGIVASPSEILELTVHRHPEGVEIYLEIVAARFAELEQQQRNLTGRTGCGLCGAKTLAQAIRHPRAVSSQVRVAHIAVQRAVQALGERQPLNAITGAVHAAAWVDVDGDIQLSREDVGRHNALDKLIGASLVRELAFKQGWLLLTSRASYEMVQKAAMVGIELIAAISAPTGLAIRLAQETGVTLVAFVRDDRHTVYANPQRLAQQNEALVA